MLKSCTFLLLHQCFLRMWPNAKTKFKWIFFFLIRHHKTHQIAAAWQWWELRCETEIIPALWGRQKWGDRSPTRHRTRTKCHQRSHISVFNLFKYIVIIIEKASRLMWNASYPSHPPVVMVVIFISWLYERKGPIVASHVTCQANQHLQKIAGMKQTLWQSNLRWRSTSSNEH